MPGGSTSPMCRASCIPGGLRTRYARHRKEVEEQLRAELQAIETLLETNGLPMKKDTLDKVRKQLAGISALVDLWWQTVRQDLTQLAMTPRWTQWAEEVLLPLMYWQEQLAARAVRGKRPRSRSCSRRLKRPSSGIRVPGSSNLRCWRVGKRGRLSMPGRSSGPRRRLRDETAISRRCSTTIAACPRVAIRCGRCCTTSIVGPQTGRHRRHGFSGGRFPICLRACCYRSTSCPCPGNVVRPSRQVIEGARCPGLSGYPQGATCPLAGRVDASADWRSPVQISDTTGGWPRASPRCHAQIRALAHHGSSAGSDNRARRHG